MRKLSGYAHGSRSQQSDYILRIFSSETIKCRKKGGDDRFVCPHRSFRAKALALNNPHAGAEAPPPNEEFFGSHRFELYPQLTTKSTDSTAGQGHAELAVLLTQKQMAAEFFGVDSAFRTAKEESFSALEKKPYGGTVESGTLHFGLPVTEECQDHIGIGVAFESLPGLRLLFTC